MVTIWGSGMALCTEIAVAVPCCVSTTGTKLVTLGKINGNCPLFPDYVLYMLQCF